MHRVHDDPYCHLVVVLGACIIHTTEQADAHVRPAGYDENGGRLATVRANRTRTLVALVALVARVWRVWLLL
jgi:hypothetical protein